MKIAAIIILAYILVALWFWGFTTGRDKHQRWWIGFAVALLWLPAFGFSIYVKRKARKANDPRRQTNAPRQGE